MTREFSLALFRFARWSLAGGQLRPSPGYTSSRRTPTVSPCVLALYTFSLAETEPSAGKTSPRSTLLVSSQSSDVSCSSLFSQQPFLYNLEHRSFSFGSLHLEQICPAEGLSRGSSYIGSTIVYGGPIPIHRFSTVGEFSQILSSSLLPSWA
jgi:hypothetical protein